MRARSVVELEAAAKNATRVPFVEYDHVVQALALERADDAFAVAVLRRTAHGGHDSAAMQGLDLSAYLANRLVRSAVEREFIIR